jgi:two-component system OmpR family sensor kinase
MISLRRTALVWMTALLAIVAACAAVISYAVVRDETASFLDGQLREIALNVGEGLPDTAGPPVKHDPEDEFAIAIWDASGKQVRPTPGDVALPRQSRLGFATISVGDDDWRIYTSGDDSRTVQIAQRMVVRRELAENAAIQAAAPILLLIPLAWLVISWSLGPMLKRLSVLARAVTERAPESKEPVATAEVPAEVLPLVQAMNDLMGRLQRALDQQRRFVADAAHELRTPLAALQIQIDNLRGALAAGATATDMTELTAGVRRASTLVDQLLQMARLEMPATEARQETVDLTALITECVGDHMAIATAKGIDLGFGALYKASLVGVPADLKMLFGNLIDNAVRYTPAPGSVDVSVRPDAAGVVVEVVDSGPGVAESDLACLFDRFFRAAPADVEGTGLGLAIAHAVAKRYGLGLTLANRHDRSGLRARVTFPASPAAGLILS